LSRTGHSFSRFLIPSFHPSESSGHDLLFLGLSLCSESVVNK
jgi:hypothetical protein